MQSDQDTAEISWTALALDIGGTAIKSGLVDSSGACRELPLVPVNSDGTKEEILAAFAAALRPGIPFDRVGVAICGPFDYARGVSLMTHKFAALHGVELLKELRVDQPLSFRHDANAFLAGELWKGAALGRRRALGVTLGTGVGVACHVDGVFQVDELGSPAAEVSVWNRPCRGGILEDHVSTRALVANYRKAFPRYEASKGAKGVAEAALSGEPVALRLFAEFGTDLGKALAPVRERFRPELVVFGGRIAQSFELFKDPIQTELPGVALARSSLGAAAALYGVAAYKYSVQ